MERIVMNSESLQKHFPEVYRDFFARNDLVVSGCFNFPWTRDAGNHARNFFRVKTSIGLQCYIGITFTSEIGAFFEDVISFDVNKAIFEKTAFIDLIKEQEKLALLLLQEIKKLGMVQGLKIEILSETTRGHGFGFSGTVSALISSALYEVYHFLHKTSEDSFSQIYLLSAKMDYISRYGNTFGHNTIFTLKPTNGISCFYTEDTSLSPENLDEIEKIGYNYTSLPFEEGFEFPLDYVMIFSGLKTDTKQVEYLRKKEYESEVISDFVQTQVFDAEKEYYVNKFSQETFVQSTKQDMVTIQNLKMFKLFHELSKKPYDDFIISSLIEQLNNIRFATNLLEKQSDFSEDFLYTFQSLAVNREEKVGISSSYTSKLGGSYIVILKQGISRKTLDTTIENLKQKYPQIDLEFASYLDGTQSSPIKREQFISAGEYSKYVDKNKVVFENNKGERYLGNYGELLGVERRGFLLDTLEGKIYFQGVKLTSKDIPSQNTTIEVITKLLQNIGKEISNKEFSNSSYTSNKNEMLGKIILPLLKFVEGKTGHKLPIVCKGGITDFYLKMEPIETEIGIIKKI